MKAFLDFLLTWGLNRALCPLQVIIQQGAEGLPSSLVIHKHVPSGTGLLVDLKKISDYPPPLSSTYVTRFLFRLPQSERKQHVGKIRSCSPSLIRCLSPVSQAVPTAHLPPLSSGPGCAGLTREKCACSPEPLCSGLSIVINLVWIGTFYFLASHIFYNTLLICVFSTSFKFKTGYFQCPVQTTPPGSLPHPSATSASPTPPGKHFHSDPPCAIQGPWLLPMWEGPHLGAFICHAPGMQAG